MASLLGFNFAFLNQHIIIGIVSIISISFLAAEFNIRILDKYLQTEYYILGILVDPFVFGVTGGFSLPLILDIWF